MNKEKLDEIETYLKEKVVSKGYDVILQIVKKDKRTDIISNIKDESILLDKFLTMYKYYELKNIINGVEVKNEN